MASTKNNRIIDATPAIANTITTPVHRGRVKRRFALFFATIAAIMVIATTVTLKMMSTVNHTRLKALDKATITLASKLAAHDFESVLSDLFLLQSNQQVKQLPSDQTPSKSLTSTIALDMLKFMIHKELYDQLRIINKNGQEIIRVNYNHGTPEIVHDDDLQDKSNRYYFRETNSLDRGDFFVSRFDLNVENQKIEQPLKPMIRFATPLYNHRNERVGIIILNYLGEVLRDHVRATSDRGQMMLINSGGYWLMSPRSEDEWGFMLGHYQRFSSRFPDAWRVISNGKTGHLHTSNGMFVFETIDPYRDLSHSYKIKHPLTAKEIRPWKFVLHIPSAELRKAIYFGGWPILAIAALILPFVWIGSWHLALSQVARQIAETLLRQSNAELEERVNERTARLQSVIATQQAQEQALNKNQQRLNRAQEISHLGNWEWHIQSGDLWWSDEVYRIYGLNPDSTIVTIDLFMDHIHVDDRDKVNEAIRQSLSQLKPYQVNHRIKRADGSIRHVLERGEVVTNDRGEAVGIDGTLLDTTEQHTIITALQESESRFRRMTDEAPALIWASDTKKLCTYFNASWLRYTGRTLDQELGNGWSEGVHPDDLSRRIKTYNEAFEARKNFSMEYRLRRANGSYGHIVDAGIPRTDMDGVFQGYIGYCWDISDQIEAQHLLQERNKELRCLYSISTILEQPDLDIDPMLQAIPDTLIAGWHYPENTVARITFDDIQHASKGFKESMWCQHSDLEIDGQARGSIEVCLIAPPPSQFPAFLPEEQELIDEVAKRVVQTLARRNQDQALRRTQKMDAIGKLTGGIAHDFNNLLGIMIGNLDMLERKLAGDDALSKRIRTAQKAALRGASLTQRLLQFSRTESKGKVSTDINKILEEMSDMINRSITSDIETRYNLTPDIGLTDVDPSDLEDAIINIILNAKQAMPKGGRLTLETGTIAVDESYAQQRPGLETGDYVTLGICDTGHGMPQEVLERVFEPFFTTKKKDAGTGLGLSMVYGFSKRSRGYINIYSEVGHGTRVKLYLPRSQHERVTEKPEPQTEAIPLGHGELVLVVDDEADIRDIAQGLLNELGYQTIAAASAPEAMALLEQRNDIDLVLSDIIMPGGMSGIELAETIQSRWPTIKILLTSGFTAQHTEEDATRHSHGGLLVKPYRQDTLAQKVFLALSSQ